MNISSLPKPYHSSAITNTPSRNALSEKTGASLNKSDSVSFSKDSVESLLQIGDSVDNGAAAATALFMDKTSFKALIDLTLKGDPKSESGGFDATHEWVVINGQRFEYQRTPEEIAERKRAEGLEGKELQDFLDEVKKKHAVQKKHGVQIKPPHVENGKLQFEADQIASDPKLGNLVKNEPVMRALSRLAAQGITIQMHS